MNRLINEKIGAWLLEQGHSREVLAKELGMTRPTLNSRLDGRGKWSWEEVIRLSRLLGCTLDELAGVATTA
jgi:plasmid maintenance system antidote protein VapI